ncbi:hypothetical protein DRN86_02755 [Candidatus Geothermarchaeota archaeon]|nr:MAG: hypothetical protein DRN86_02755 [Candidatus Geothermarchaeota archaeon]
MGEEFERNMRLLKEILEIIVRSSTIRHPKKAINFARALLKQYGIGTPPLMPVPLPTSRFGVEKLFVWALLQDMPPSAAKHAVERIAHVIQNPPEPKE